MGATDLGLSTIAYTQATVAVNNTTAVDVLQPNAQRQYALFINDSANIIYLMIGATAVASQGIRLNPNGGSYEMAPVYNNLSGLKVSAISAAGTGQNLLVVSG